MKNSVDELRRIARFVLKKPYRDYIARLEVAGKTECINTCESPTKKIMILRRDISTVGTFSDYNVFLRMIENAIERNYIPIIDRKTVKNVFLSMNEDVNAWECLFEQPFGIGMEDIDYSDSEVWLHHIPSAFSPVSVMHCQETAIIDFWRKTAKRYIRLQPDIKTMVESKANALIEGKRVVGVAIREGYDKLANYKIEEIKNHPRQASIDKMIDLIKGYMEEWDCEYVFFTCQTLETVSVFKNEFKDRAMCLEKDRVTYDNLVEGSDLSWKMQKEKQYKNEIDYVTEISLLSRCTCFVCSENSGAEAAFIMSEGFEHFVCINEGTY